MSDVGIGWTISVLRCEACGASWTMPRDEPHDCAVATARNDRDRWVRLFNRLEAAVSHHKRDTAGFATDADERLYAARERILRDAATGPSVPGRSTATRG